MRETGRTIVNIVECLVLSLFNIHTDVEYLEIHELKFQLSSIQHYFGYLVRELFTNSTSLISNQYNINVRLAEQLALHEDF